MKKICLYSDNIDQGIFDLNNSITNRDNCLYSLFFLKKEFERYGYDLSTPDVNPKDNSDIIIYLEMPHDVPPISEKHKSFLIIFETEVISPVNWTLSFHEHFSKIFTWNDHYVDNKKYFKINWTHLIPKSIIENMKYKEKLCALIAGNKTSEHPLELYSKRREAIRWFEKNHPTDFDLFGSNWNNNFLLRELQKYQSLNQIVNIFKEQLNYYPSYRGRIDSKLEVLKKYRFSICYENVQNTPGYITEKIFDSFFAGCVPIYWGANNIDKHIPKNVFINKNSFPTYENLFNYINFMSETEYKKYISNIDIFLKSDDIYQFTPEHFTETIIHNIIFDQSDK